MCRPRSQLVSLADTPYYHIVSRCVRRSFLCGVDQSSGQNYEHRREWIETRLFFLSSLFAIDIAAYAVMSNHYHLVVKLDPTQIASLNDEDILLRWCSLFKGPEVVRSTLSGEVLSQTAANQIKDLTALYRQRLTDLGWFMKCLNEPIARQANAEDQCTGHFWESRYKSQALRSEKALLSCMAYVDLNPVRAAMAETPEQSDFTSIKERISPSLNLANSVGKALNECLSINCPIPKPLMQFKTKGSAAGPDELPIEWPDYLCLVDLTGRSINPMKRGSIDTKLAPILSRIDVSEADWIDSSNNFETHFTRRRYCKNIEQTT